jgi:hypothetical protein
MNEKIKDWDAMYKLITFQHMYWTKRNATYKEWKDEP